MDLHPTPSRSLLVRTLVAAIALSLAFAAPAQADAIDAVSAIPAAATTAVAESAASTEPVTTVPETATEPTTTATEPEAAPETGGGTAIATDSVNTVVESTPPVSPPSSSASPVPVHVSTDAPSHLSDAVRSLPADVAQVQTGLNAATAPVTQQVPELIRQIPERSVEAVRSIVEQPLASIEAEVTRPPPLLGRVTSAPLEESQPQPRAERFPGIDWEPSGEETAGPLHSPGSLFRDTAFGYRQGPFAGRPFAGSLMRLGVVGSHRPKNDTSGPGAPEGPLTSVPSVYANGAHFGPERSNRDAPLGPSAPIPESPGSAAPGPGSNGSFFVPLAALLALLALVAPATFRRLREVPDLPAPTPFVCALERPG
jgi:hypothetical protein